MDAAEKTALLELLDRINATKSHSGDLLDLLYKCQGILEAWRRWELPRTESYWWLAALDSDLDRFPLGPSREHWNHEALKEIDHELYKLFEDAPSEAKSSLTALARDLECYLEGRLP